MANVTATSPELFYVYISLDVISILNSVLILVVLLKSRMRAEPTGMLLVNQAFCDLALGVMYVIMSCQNLINGEMIWNILQSNIVIYVLLKCESFQTLAFVAAILYVAIRKPTVYTRVVTLRNIVLLTVISWCVNTLFSSLLLLGSTHSGKITTLFKHTARCQPWLVVILLLLLVILPLGTVLFCYSSICMYICKLHRAVSSGGSSSQRTSKYLHCAQGLMTISVIYMTSYLLVVASSFVDESHDDNNDTLVVTFRAGASIIHYTYTCFKFLLFILCYPDFRYCAKFLFCLIKPKDIPANRS